jgi:peptidyl-prolyl cis-trans isomerase A (cyclophilin A)
VFRFGCLIILSFGFLVQPVSAEDPALEDDFVPPAGLHDGWYARIDTDEGRILARLHPEQAPQSVAHFAKLAQGELGWLDPVTGEELTGHYYDGVPIHRAVALERFEAGDRGGTGRGAPSLFVAPEGLGPIDFTQAWRMGMTVGGGNKISAVQFFVSAASQPFLNGRHPCFGTVISGKDVVDRITSVKTYSNGRPVEPVIIERIRVFSVGDVEPLAEPVTYKPRPTELQLNDRFSK